MLILPRKRLILWLVRAYIRKWGKMIIFFFILGVTAALLIFLLLPKFTTFTNSKVIGVSQVYTTSTLPLEIQEKLSFGLTQVEETGKTTNKTADTIEISEDKKTYVVHLRDDIFWQDGKKFRAQDVNYNFKDAKLTVIDDKTLKFELTEPFSPFLTVISKPIFKKKFAGLGDYRIKKIETTNEGFVETLTLVHKKEKEAILYRFYPTQEALETAFTLGEIDSIKTYNGEKFQNWKNLKIEEEANLHEVIAIFFNTRDPSLSQKNVRQALVYSLTDNFPQSKQAASPLSPLSFAYSVGESEKYQQNLEKAKELLGDKTFSLDLKVDSRLQDLANIVVEDWRKLGIEVKKEVVTSPPEQNSFQVFLGILRIPSDPDQYILWHSTQSTNITGYANPRIDKLLEDGRKTNDETERTRLYADFQKYIVDDAPAAFLYYPTVYTVKRK